MNQAHKVYIYANEVSIKIDKNGALSASQPLRVGRLNTGAANEPQIVANTLSDQDKDSSGKIRFQYMTSTTGKNGELNQIDDLMVGISNGKGVLIPGGGDSRGGQQGNFH